MCNAANLSVYVACIVFALRMQGSVTVADAATEYHLTVDQDRVNRQASFCKQVIVVG